jgi:hypothetical protein
MKTVTVTPAQPELRKLIEEAYGGTPVVLAYGDKKVKLERYVPAVEPTDFDLEEDSVELETELLKAIKGPFTPYSRQDIESIAARARRDKAAS